MRVGSGLSCVCLCGDRILHILQGARDHIETCIHSINVKCAPTMCKSLFLALEIHQQTKK